MPYYEYKCLDCHRRARFFYTYEEYDNASPICPNCQGKRLSRVIGRVALAKSDSTRLENLESDTFLDGLDEEDPRTLGRAMRRMNEEMGEDLGPEFNEVVERLESGQSPASIEKSMPELSESSDVSLDQDP